MKLNHLILVLLLSTRIFSQNYIYTPTPIQNGNEQFGLSSLKSLGKTRHVVSFLLPPNTVKWYFVYSSSRNKSDVVNTQNTFNLLGKLSRVIDNTGIMNNVLQQIGTPPGFDACDLYTLASQKDVDPFESKRDLLGNGFNYIQEYSKKNSISGVVEVSEPNRQSGWQYLGFINKNFGYPLEVNLQVVAIVKSEEEKNGWTKTIKDKFYDQLKNGVADYDNVSPEVREKIISCFIDNLTKKFSPQQFVGLTKYEQNEAFKKIINTCRVELKMTNKK